MDFWPDALFAGINLDVSRYKCWRLEAHLGGDGGISRSVGDDVEKDDVDFLISMGIIRFFEVERNWGMD